jgi:transposase
VSPQDGVLDSLVRPDVNAERRSLFLAAVAQRHADEFMVMVLDGAGGPTAGDLTVPERMRLEPLPPWSPPLNPVEHLWEEVREKWMGVRGLISLERNQMQVASLTGFRWIRKIPL